MCVHVYTASGKFRGGRGYTEQLSIFVAGTVLPSCLSKDKQRAECHGRLEEAFGVCTG